jgi:hypothetical protein
VSAYDIVGWTFIIVSAIMAAPSIVRRARAMLANRNGEEGH